jgi:4-hydroxybenzoate polyprenyltransferase
MDKIGYAMGDIGRQRCLTYVGAEDARSTHREGLQITQARGKWITLIECVSACGSTLAPYVMYKGSGLNQAWVVEDEPLIGKDWSFAASKSGWTNNKMGYQWLVKHFDPLTRADSARRLLIVDGHGSHVIARFASYCFDNY